MVGVQYHIGSDKEYLTLSSERVRLFRDTYHIKRVMKTLTLYSERVCLLRDTR